MLGLSLRLALVCAVCGQERDESAARETAVLVELVGVVAYGVCPCCGQRAPNSKDNAYRMRVWKWQMERAKAAARKARNR